MMDNREKTPATNEPDELRNQIAQVPDLGGRILQAGKNIENNPEALRNSARWLKMFRDCNQTMVGASQEFLLLHDICRIVVDAGGYQKAWVGYAQQDAKKRYSRSPGQDIRRDLAKQRKLPGQILRKARTRPVSPSGAARLTFLYVTVVLKSLSP